MGCAIETEEEANVCPADCICFCGSAWPLPRNYTVRNCFSVHMYPDIHIDLNREICLKKSQLKCFENSLYLVVHF